MANQTELDIIDSGVVTTASPAGSNVLTDETKNWLPDVHAYRGVRVGSQFAHIQSNSQKSLVIYGAWAQPLAVGSEYLILGFDFAQVLRDVFGQGSNINLANPLEVHDPAALADIAAVEAKLDNATWGLAALKAALDSLAGGAFYGSYGPKNVEVDNDVDFGTILYDPSGNIITVGEITPGTYTVHRVRGAIDTEIIAAIASSEAAGRVFITYNFPVANWQVGDIFYITFSGITVTIDGITTEYPDLYIWGRVVREADISAKVDAVEGKLDDPATGLAAIKTVIDAILVDTSTTLETKLDNIKTVVDAVLVDTSTTLEAKLDAIKVVVDAILVDTATTLEGKLDVLGPLITAIKVVTDNLPNAGALTTLTAYVDTLETSLGAFTAVENLKAILGDLSTAKRLGQILGALDETNTLKAILGAYTAAAPLKTAIDTIAGYLDTEIAVILAAVDTEVAAIEAKLDLATLGATFSYLDAGGEQTVFTFTPTANSEIHTIWLDLATLTQNTTIRLKHQIDGATYRTFETFNWTTGMDDGVYFRDIVVMLGRPIQVTMQETADEGAPRAIPYYYVYEER